MVQDEDDGMKSLYTAVQKRRQPAPAQVIMWVDVMLDEHNSGCGRGIDVLGCGQEPQSRHHFGHNIGSCGAIRIIIFIRTAMSYLC